jgi:hypothetical protein
MAHNSEQRTRRKRLYNLRRHLFARLCSRKKMPDTQFTQTADSKNEKRPSEREKKLNSISQAEFV